MSDENKTKTQLINELKQLRAQNEILDTRQNDKKYIEIIINQLPIPITILKVNNVNGEYQYTYEFVNTSCAKLNNKTPEEHIGRTIDEIITNEKAAYDIKANFHKVIKSKKTTVRKINIPIEGKNGQLLEFHFPIEYNNSVVSVGAALIDITELVQAKEEAEKANLAKSEFLSRMNHELRTPLNAILGFAQIMDRYSTKKLDEKNQENLQHILKAGQHLKLLIEEVLDLSRVESGKIELALEDVPVGPVIDEIISQMEPLQKSFGVRIVTENLADAEHAILVNKMRFKQILINLISNAIKYNRAEGIVSISVDTQPEAIAISVRDTGVGIPQERMDDLFEPFNRLNYEFGDIEGTGIGLSITKQLVSLMNGTIAVESKVGEGSCFTVSFPRGKNISPEPDTTIGLDRPQESHPEAEPVQILYIEDNLANIELMEDILKLRPNVHLRISTDAEKGIELAKAHRPDVILMDLRLPGMDGFTAFKKLKSDQKTQSIPVIAVSAHAEQSNIDKALNMGFGAYISKPIAITSFFNTIDSILTDA